VRYMGKCRNLTAEERNARLASGITPTVRFRVPEGQTLVIKDLVRGDVSFETDNMGDFIIVKSDGIPTYNFAVVIDDHQMEVSHVVRAEEHLSNTPRQLLIYNALGFNPPEFAHISLILGKDRQKMSKRHGATSVMQYRENGYLPEAIFNFLALLGWSPEGEQEILDADQIIKQFGLDRVAKNPAVFDLDKLNWINAQYIKRKTTQELGQMIMPFLVESPYINAVASLDTRKFHLLIDAIRERLVNLRDAQKEIEPFFAPPLYDSEATKILAQEETQDMFKRVMEFLPDPMIFEDALSFVKHAPKSMELPAKKVLMPLRIALTGLTKGPELPHLMAVMGADEVKRRIKGALEYRGI
ncbi:MAG: glutamate--tRNA ligase, partial [Chitinophagales bacterium]